MTLMVCLTTEVLPKSKSFRANRKPESFISFHTSSCSSLLQSSILLKCSLSNSFSNCPLVNYTLVRASVLISGDSILLSSFFSDSWMLT